MFKGIFKDFLNIIYSRAFIWMNTRVDEQAVLEYNEIADLKQRIREEEMRCKGLEMELSKAEDENTDLLQDSIYHQKRFEKSQEENLKAKKYISSLEKQVDKLSDQINSSSNSPKSSIELVLNMESGRKEHLILRFSNGLGLKMEPGSFVRTDELIRLAGLEKNSLSNVKIEAFDTDKFKIVKIEMGLKHLREKKFEEYLRENRSYDVKKEDLRPW